MSCAQSSRVRCLTAQATILAVCLTASPVAGDAAADAAKRRAEIERKSRENKARGDAIRKDVEAHQREVRARLNLPPAASTGASAATGKPASSATPSLDEMRKKMKDFESRGLSKAA